MKSKLAHQIKHRQYANDEFMTPEGLAESLVPLVSLVSGDIVLDACIGEGAFISAFPSFVASIGVESDFYSWNLKVDWIITNPPYSDLDRWLRHSFLLSDKGVALLLGLLNITPKRLEMANKMGFGVVKMHLCKVFHWFGISAFCIWERGKPDILSYDRIVWR